MNVFVSKYTVQKKFQVLLIDFSHKTVNHAWFRSWDQPVLNNEGKVTCSRKQHEPLIWLKLMTRCYIPVFKEFGLHRYVMKHGCVFVCLCVKVTAEVLLKWELYHIWRVTLFIMFSISNFLKGLSHLIVKTYLKISTGVKKG